MDRDMTIAGLVSALKGEIAQRKRLLAELEARMGAFDAPREPRISVASTAVEILREAGRPMHGLREILPALESRGVAVKSRVGFATLLLRTGKIIRTAPGTFALKPADAAGG